MAGENTMSRKEQILQSLARMLEASPGGRITTAGLAKEVGVSEAALYRHFPSKAKMFEGLIVFIEDTIFSRISKVTSSESSALEQCEAILSLLLGFSERNPGISRLLTGDALTGETERLRVRINQFFDRFEMELRTVIREAELKESQRSVMTPAVTANMLASIAEGKILRFVRSDFKHLPTEGWNEQWQYVQSGIMRAAG